MQINTGDGSWYFCTQKNEFIRGRNPAVDFSGLKTKQY